jgi:hypothetical protein
MAPFVATLSTETWILLALVAGAGLTAVLHTLAKAFDEERKVHDLKRKVHELRRAYAKRLAEINGRGPAEFVDDKDVQIVDETN